MSFFSATFKSSKELDRYLSSLPDSMHSKAKDAFSTSAFEVHRVVSGRVTDGKNNTLTSRTGALRRSLTFLTTGTNLGNLNSSVYSTSIYAPIHELGGTISARRAYRNLPGGPYLNIPSQQNKTAAGVTRKTAQQVFASGGYIIPIRAPRARYAVMLAGVPMFWLVKSVDIPARLGMRAAVDAEIPTLLSNLKDLSQEALQ